MHSKWRLSHVQGYLGLGMVAEAAAELDRLPDSERDTTPVLSLRLAILQEQQNWPALRDAAIEFVRRTPGEAGGWITWAYAVRRAETLAAAEVVLRIAETKHPADPTIQFNLGCYACQGGDLPEARRRVDRAIALDQKFRGLAATDPDLAPLRATGKNADRPPGR
jgi:Tfp pilus assembly protein PilF